MTNVICHWTTMDPRTLEAITRWVPQAKLIQSTDLDSYRRTLIRHWTGRRDLIILEPDMGITEYTVMSLQDCRRDWCAYGYMSCWRTDMRSNEIGFARTIHSLGATKVSARAQERVPACDWVFSTEQCPVNCNGRWWHLDRHISHTLMRRGFRPHDHGDIEHYHDYGPPDVAPLKVQGHSGSREELLDILRKRGWNHPERMSIFNG